MIPGLTPSAVAAIATLPPGYSEAVGNPFRAVLSEPGAQLVYLVKAMPRDPDARISVPGWPGPVAAGPVTGPAVYRGGGVAIYWGSQHYLTEPTDVPSSTLWRGVLQQPYSAEMRLFGGTDPFGAAESGFGSVVALNGDGDYDAVTGYNWAGAAIEILVGGAGRPLSDFAVVARPEGDGLGWDRERIELRLRDRLRILSRSVARRVYTGAGGVDGAAAIAGQPAPLCYGQVRHAPLKMIDPVALLLQAHDGPIHAVAAVYERGLAFPPAVADYPTPAALLSADVPAGHYATCLASGYVRLGSIPYGVITADIEGDAAGGYVSTAGAIARRLVQTRLGDRSLSDADLDMGALARCELARPWTIGLWSDDDVTVDDLVVRAMRSVGATRYIARDGRLTFLALARQTKAKATIGAADIDDAGIKADATVQPVWRVKVGYGRLRTVFADADLAGAIDDASLRASLRTEYHWAVAKSEAIRARNADAVELVLETDLVDQASALALAEVALDLCGGGRWIVPLRQPPFLYDLADAVTVDPARAWSGAGRVMLVAGIREDAANGSHELELYG